MTDLERAPDPARHPGPERHQRQRPYLRRLGAEPDGHRRGHRRLAPRQGPVATVAIEAMEFIAPIHLRDLISVYAEVERVGRTSMGVRIEVIATRDLGATEVKVTEGLFTFVALDANTGRGRSISRGRRSGQLRRSGRGGDLVVVAWPARGVRVRRRGLGAGSSSSSIAMVVGPSAPIAGGSTSSGRLSSRRR